MTDVLRYSAFAATADGGNPAGVVLDADGLGADEMVAVAARVGYSETAFVVGGAEPEYDVRYASPAAEVPFCGHATVALAVALAERNGPAARVFRTPAGPIALTTRRDDDGTVTASFTSVEPHVDPLDDGVLDRLLSLLGLTRADLDPRFRPMTAFAGNPHPVLVLRDPTVFHQFRFDPRAVAALMLEQGWTGTVTVLLPSGDHDYEARNLFPVGRITEDPATGSAAASTGAYLRALGVVRGGERVTIAQGRHVGRPSVLLVDVPAAGGITVTGGAERIG